MDIVVLGTIWGAVFAVFETFFFSRFLFIRNLQQKGHAQNSTQQITSTPYIGRRMYRAHRRAICALCLAEMTLVRVQRSNKGSAGNLKRFRHPARATPRLPAQKPQSAWRLLLPRNGVFHSRLRWPTQTQVKHRDKERKKHRQGEKKTQTT